MADYPALPLWTDALLGDTAHLTNAEFGLYLRLLILMWRLPTCSVPNDDGWLERHLRTPSVEIRVIIVEFCQCDGNRVWQKRLSRERAWVQVTSQRQSVRAKARWKKEKDLCRGNAALHASGNAPTPTPTLPLAKANGHASITDLKAIIFGDSLQWLATASGKPAPKLRSLLGLWCKTHGDGAVLDALAAAQRESPVEPVAWLQARLAGHKRPRPSAPAITPLGVGG